jgi:hypothetical protein
MEKRHQAMIVLGLGLAYGVATGVEWMGFAVEARIWRFAYLFAWVCCAAGLKLLWRTGIFQASPLRRYGSIVVALYILTVLFQIMHWPFVMPLMAVAMLGIMVIYGIHFYLKSTKGTRDILRLLVVLIVTTMVSLMRMHLVPTALAFAVAVGIVCLAVLEYLLHPYDGMAALDNSKTAPGTSQQAEDQQAKLGKDYPELFQ